MIWGGWARYARAPRPQAPRAPRTRGTPGPGVKVPCLHRLATPHYSFLFLCHSTEANDGIRTRISALATRCTGLCTTSAGGRRKCCFLSPYIIFMFRLPTSGTGGIRTHDLSVNSRLLFLLSFSPKKKTPLDIMIQRRSLT